MRNVYFLFLLLLSTALFAGDEPQVLRALLIGDIRDQDIGDDCKVDLKNMEKNLTEIASQLHLKTEIKVIENIAPASETALSWIERLPQSASDIVVFYYTGHGCGNAMSANQWPVLGLKNRTIASELINQSLRNQSHRLIITLFDCCNYGAAVPHIRRIRPGVDVLISERLKGLENLFMKTKGSILACAAQRDEYATTDQVAEEGSTFSNGFCHALCSLCKSRSVSWDEVMEKVQRYCVRTPNAQDIYYEINKE